MCRRVCWGGYSCYCESIGQLRSGRCRSASVCAKFEVSTRRISCSVSTYDELESDRLAEEAGPLETSEVSLVGVAGCDVVDAFWFTALDGELCDFGVGLGDEGGGEEGDGDDAAAADEDEEP